MNPLDSMDAAYLQGLNRGSVWLTNPENPHPYITAEAWEWPRGFDWARERLTA